MGQSVTAIAFLNMWKGFDRYDIGRHIGQDAMDTIRNIVSYTRNVFKSTQIHARAYS